MTKACRRSHGWSLGGARGSLCSGEACAKALEAEGFVVTKLDVDRSIAETAGKTQTRRRL